MPTIYERPPFGTPPAPVTLPDYSPRGPFGVSANVSGYEAPNWNWISRFSERTPGEQNHIQNISDLARLISGQGTGLFNVGSPAYADAINYYRRLLSGSRPAVTEAVAPEAQATSEIYKGAERSLAAGPLRGGAREAATSELGRQKTGQIAGLAAQVRPQAAAAAGSLGLQGAQAGTQAEGTGAGVYSNLLGLEQGNRQAAQGMSLQQQQLGAQTALGAARLTLDDLVQSGQLGLDEYRVMTGNDLAKGRLTLDQYLGQGNLTLNQQRLALEKQRYLDEQKQRKGGLLGSILGTALSFIPGGSLLKLLGLGGGGGPSAAESNLGYGND